MKRKSGRSNLLRRIEELETCSVDGSGLVPHSQQWLAQTEAKKTDPGSLFRTPEGGEPEVLGWPAVCGPAWLVASIAED
jgi:hypothetical protein